MTQTTDLFGDQLVEAVPVLRRFARRLTRDAVEADDLLQQTLLKGWLYRGRFEAGSNLEAWLSCIMRRQFYTDRRKAQREVQGIGLEQPSDGDLQGWHMTALQVQAFIGRMKPAQRAALMTVGAGGSSHGEATADSEQAVGTSKSRLSRARAVLRGAFDPADLFETAA